MAFDLRIIRPQGRGEFHLFLNEAVNHSESWNDVRGMGYLSSFMQFIDFIAFD